MPPRRSSRIREKISLSDPKPRGRSRDRASSSSPSKTTRSARSRDRSRDSADVTDNPIVEIASLPNQPITEAVAVSKIESKMSEVPTNTPGPKPESKNDSRSDETRPPWIQQLLCTLDFMSSEITALKNNLATMNHEIITLRKENTGIRANLSKCPTCLNIHKTSNLSARDDIERPIGDPQSTKEMDVDPPNNRIMTIVADSQPKLPLQPRPTSTPPHANWLHKKFLERINLQPTERTEVNITTFDGVFIAKGYNRILPTWQGYFIELEESDICWDRLQRNDFPADGEESWILPGIKVFKLTRPDNRKTPRPHRFALKTSPDFTACCNPLLLDKWYIHAYQARFLVGNRGKSLNSRTMAIELQRMYPDNYHPRGKEFYYPTDHQSNTRAQAPQRQNSAQRTHQNSYPSHQPQKSQTNPHIVSTPFVPLPLHNQPYLPPGTHIPTTYTHPTPLLNHPWPKGIATQQNLLAPGLWQQNQTNYPYNVQIPYHASPALNQTWGNRLHAQQQKNIPTYAEVANPHQNVQLGRSRAQGTQARS